MTSRLERLFLLLETGQSTFLRRSAAYQIGEIVKTHPKELGQLLEKIKPLVTSSSWETRIAASQTIESIMKYLDDRDLITDFFQPNPSNPDLTLENFDLNNLLASGATLLSSDTQKYDIKNSDTNQSQTLNNQLSEKLKQQRNLLNLKLGIDVAGAAKLDTTHIFSDYDIIASQAEILAANSHTEVEVCLKRKGSELGIKIEPDTSNGHSSVKKLKLEDEPEDHLDEQAEEKSNHIQSLLIFTKWLFSRLFNSEWEIRHGSATCLREIIKKLINTLLLNNNLNLIPNYNWFETCLYKLFSVIALDRFADYIGDEVVAPVRETCTQTIGIISKLFTISSHDTNRLCSIINMYLTREISDNNWEIRHSGIMILKYTIAAANAANQLENLKKIFSLTFENILKCIKDSDDDVRQVASSSLEPVSKRLNNLLNTAQIESLIRILIDVLSDLDDLGTSCSNIMCLLSDLLSLNENQLIFIELLSGQSILPRLLPFLNHSSLTVKQTTLNTINKIIVAINTNLKIFKFEAIEKNENLSLLFRILYQQAILMSSESGFKMLETLLIDLWQTLCYNISPKLLVNLCFPYITTWLVLLMYPCNQQIDTAYLVNNNDTAKEYLGSNQIRFEDKLVRDLVQIKCRLLSSKLLSILFHRVSQIEDVDALTGAINRPFDLILNFLSNQINFKSGLQRFCFSLLIIDLATRFKENKTEGSSLTSFEMIQTNLSTKITTCLDDENTIYFDEIAILFTRLQKEIRFLMSNYQKYLNTNLGISLNEYANKSVFTFDDITSLTSVVQERLNASVLATTQQKHDVKLIAELKLLISNLIELNKQAFQEQEQLQIRSLFALASACIQLSTQCERMNPLIRPLIECIRFESNPELQSISSKHLAVLLQICSKRQPNPVPKIFKNLLNYLCIDHSKTPLMQNQPNITCLPDKDYYEINRYYGIISDTMNTSDANTHDSAVPTTPNTPITPNKLKRRTSSSNGAQAPEQAQAQTQTNGNGNGNSIQVDLIKNQIEKRGAELAFKSIIEYYNSLDKLESVVPDLIQQPLNQINAIASLINNSNSDELSQISELNLDLNMSKYQDLINYLCLIEYVCSLESLDKMILNKFMDKVPDMMKLIKLPLSSVRSLIAKCLATMCKQELVRTMQIILEYTLDCLDNNEFNLFSRQGAIELIYCLFEQLNNSIIPFIVIFIVPILKRMCDLDWYVRSMASQCFGTLVKLYPLSSSQFMNDSLTEITQSNPNILRMKLEQQDFLDQLMDNRKLKSYELPHDVLINVKLRPYQQMGVNWLNFLKKFNLHGILCDDMGLGKTLQSICILAGDHFEKQKHSAMAQHVQIDDDDSKFTPSIIICPTTLTNHWHHEIERFVDKKCLKPFIYCGSIAERENLRRIFFKNSKNLKERNNVFIASYDIIRHDIQYLSAQKWNYCILDEGHLIKSSKTKLSKSIKLIRASHRLILTGTPIQNNVTELWCLFDFLLPGYLGTEKQFHLKYARYIAPQSASFQNKLERALSHQQQNNDSNGKTKTVSNSESGFHQLSVIALESLHKQVLPFLLRRTKEEVLKDLPPKIIQDYYCEMSPLQIELYQDFAKSNVSDNIKKSLGLLDENEEEQESEDNDKLLKKSSGEHVFQALQYLRKVVNHPSLVLKPDHPKWSKIRSEFTSSINDVKHSGKLMALRDLLLECGIGSNNNEDSANCEFDQNSIVNQHRVLIFCQLKSMIDIIETELLRKMHNVTFLRLDGTIPATDRFNVVKKFNSDPSIDILLLTTQIGGLGLNLTGADTVIFVEHDWNPQKDLQAMDRAHRIGQTKVVNVYRLITKRTIEEKIMSLQKFKLGIANSVVNIENSNLSSMGTEQLMNMFNRDAAVAPSTSSSSNTNGQNQGVNLAATGYQRLLENITELWDETQYENEYNLDNFIKSLN